MAAIGSFSIDEGDSIDVEIDINPDDEETLAASIVRFWAKRQKFSVPYGEPLIEKSSEDPSGIVVVNEAEQVLTVHFEREDTLGIPGRHWFEVHVEDGDGNIVTVSKGYMTVDPTIIRLPQDGSP